MKNGFLKLILISIFCQVHLICFSQSIRTYFIDVGNSSATVHKSNRVNASILYPFKNRYNFALGYSPFNHMSFFGSYHNQIKENFAELSTTIGRTSGTIENSNLAYNFAIGGYFVKRIITKKHELGSENSARNKLRLIIEGRIGYAKNRIASKYKYDGLPESSTNFLYNSTEGGIYITLSNNKGQIKLSNKIIRSKYSNIDISSSVFLPEKINSLNKEFEDQPIKKFHLTEFSSQINIKRVGILAGLIINHNYLSKLRFNSKEQVLLYAGLNFGISTFKKE